MEGKITKEFLEKAVQGEIVKFFVNAGSAVGDGYTCNLYAVDVWRKSDPDRAESILLKTYPEAAARQSILESMGMFTTELRVYDTIIPDLLQFQGPLDVPTVKPPVPPFLFGQFFTAEERKNLPGGWNSIDNCIVMSDLRKNGGFRLRDRHLGLDFDHYQLVIEAHAKLHALSWVYKQKVLGGGSLEDKYPFLQQRWGPEFADMIKGFVNTNVDNAKKIVDDQKLDVGIEYFRGIAMAVAELYMGLDVGQANLGHTKDNILRVKGRVVENEEPWAVLLHGDAWSNNMMFRYDAKTARPIEVLLVDLQVTREGDPMADLTYTLYTSTNQDFRGKHLTSMLHIYYDTFTKICDSFSVPYLPGWSFEELGRRFHRTKTFGAYIGMTLLPIILKNSDELQHMDTVAEGKETSEDFVEMFKDMIKNSKGSDVLTRRMRGVMDELMKDGVI